MRPGLAAQPTWRLRVLQQVQGASAHAVHHHRHVCCNHIICLQMRWQGDRVPLSPHQRHYPLCLVFEHWICHRLIQAKQDAAHPTIICVHCQVRPGLGASAASSAKGEAGQGTQPRPTTQQDYLTFGEQRRQNLKWIFLAPAACTLQLMVKATVKQHFVASGACQSAYSSLLISYWTTSDQDYVPCHLLSEDSLAILEALTLAPRHTVCLWSGAMVGFTD
eukprot:6459784-Amphidinium_carterae.2